MDNSHVPEPLQYESVGAPRRLSDAALVGFALTAPAPFLGAMFIGLLQALNFDSEIVALAAFTAPLVVGLPLSIYALLRTSNPSNRLTGYGFALAGTIFGFTWTLMFLGMAILSAR